MSVASIAQSRTDTRFLLPQTFIWMTMGLIFTAVVAWVVARTSTLLDVVAAQPVVSLVSLGAWVILGLGFGACFSSLAKAGAEAELERYPMTRFRSAK